jgi:ATP-dependent Lhr-like helicase
VSTRPPRSPRRRAARPADSGVHASSEVRQAADLREAAGPAVDPAAVMDPAGALAGFEAPTRTWFREAFPQPTRAQALGWAAIRTGRSTLLLAPTGSGKTLAAFLHAIDRVMFSPPPFDKASRLRVLYVSPLKALGVDVERNLAAPIAGIRVVATRLGVAHHAPELAVRTGDTPQAERQRMLRQPPDVLITTPESLYLLLTSQGREILRGVDTVIVDEIHAMVPTKRGAHLFLTLERLEALVGRPVQRIGLSATQRPLDEVARLLAGFDVPRGGAAPGEGAPTPRPVEIVDAGARKALELRVEVPVEDMADLAASAALPLGGDLPSGSASGPSAQRSIWPAIHPRLVELIRQHRSTMIFVNSRRLAERLAASLNEVAGEELAAAHHGSLAKEQRRAIEERLKLGALPAMVATSSMELGIDMGSVELVVQIEAPPSVASGLQRVGRANHQVGAEPRGFVFPKFRGDLLACAAVSRRMLDGKVEETFYPRNPLDVLAQQLVAMVAIEPLDVDEAFARVRQAAPFATLPRASFEGVLDMLSGRYPSDDFAELKPRLVWDRVGGRLSARQGAQRVAVVNGGTIPDRGLYGVFLVDGEEGRSKRVGELDEEMVFESRVGDVFLLGASSWRIEDITHDRVLVTPAPGESGKMPFWKGDRPGRPAELGRAIGELTRELRAAPEKDARRRLEKDHCLDPSAAKNLLTYLSDQAQATQELPTDRVILLERFVDEIGDWRVCVLTPFGARVHGPWAMAVHQALKRVIDAEIDMTWSDDGIVFRLPGADAPPDAKLFFPASDEVEAAIVDGLDQTSLFGARFRENAGRALLLPKRNPQKRMPLWALRRRSASLLQVATKYPSFPIVLETYREVLRDVFDVPALVALLKEIEQRRVRVALVETRSASPFAAALMFNYVANFMYDGDAPVAERRAQALQLDHAQLRELLGEAELRKLLDPEAIAAHEARAQRLDPKWRIRSADGLHDALLSIGELSRGELAARVEVEDTLEGWLAELVRARRVLEVRVGGEPRLIAAEDMGKYRDALGTVPPPGVPVAFLEVVPGALTQLLARWARTHGPFRIEDVARRWGLGPSAVRAGLEPLLREGRVVEGELLPGGRGVEHVDAEVLRALKRQSLARLQREVEPVDGAVLGRFLPSWQGLDKPRRGLDALLTTLEQLQGLPLPASVLEAEVLPARNEGYEPGALDELCAAGELVWRGFEPIGTSDGRIALYLTDHFARLAPPPVRAEGELVGRLRDALGERGAMFFDELVRKVGAFAPDVLAALWSLVWAGEATNDTLTPLRSLFRGEDRRRPARGRFRSRRQALPGSEGRWSLLPAIDAARETERRAALTQQLLERYGVLVREATHAEGIEGGFSAVYPVLKAMEDAGRVRRGYFVAGLGAAQFALRGADDRLRALRDEPDDAPTVRVCAALDPANPYGSILPWPERAGRGRGAVPADPEAERGARPQRAVGARVFTWRGRLVAWMARSEKSLLTFLPDDEAERAQVVRGLAEVLGRGLDDGERRAVLVEEVDGEPAQLSPLARALADVGFRPSGKGLMLRRQDRADARG